MEATQKEQEKLLRRIYETLKVNGIVIAENELTFEEGDSLSTVKGVLQLWKDSGDIARAVSSTTPLPVNVVGGSATGTEYTEGDVDATIAGVATMWEDAGNTLRSVSAATPFPVNVVAGSAAATEYTEGATDATITGIAVLWEDTADTLRPVSAVKPLPVNIVTGSSSGVQYNDGAARGSATTTLMGVDDGTLIQAASGDSSGRLNINVATALPAGTNNIGDVDVASLPGTVAADITAIKTAVEIIDNAIAGSEMQVDIVSLPNEGQQTMANSISVALASDQPAVVIADGGGSITVDGTLTTNAGTGYPAVVTDGSAAGTTGLHILGTDGTNAQIISTNASGHVNIADGGNAITVDGTVAATQSGTWNITNISGTVSLPTGAATLAEQQTQTTALQLIDDTVNTGGDTLGTKFISVGGLIGGGGGLGGSITIGQTNGGVYVEQPAGTTFAIGNISGTISLPTGAATAANQTTQITALQLLDDVVATDGSAAVTKLYQVGGTDGTNAQILSTNSSGHLNIADGGNTITVDGTVAATQSGTWNVTNVSGTVSLPTGAATSANQSTMITALQLIDDTVHANNAVLNKAIAIGGVMDDASTTAATENNVSSVRITAQRSLHVNLRDNLGNELGLVTTPVVVKQQAATSTLSNVSSSASNVTILASNTARKGASVYNDSTQILYLKFGATASTTSFTVKMQPDAYYEVPFGYTGIIDGIWASANGSARITELT